MDNVAAVLFAQKARPHPAWCSGFAARYGLCHLNAMSQQRDFAQFLATAEPAHLGPMGRSGTQPQDVLEEQLASLLQRSKLPEQNQQLIQALVLLWHDHLDTAHRIAQDVDNSDGAFVHGIMHRREPDFGNAAYWFRRVGRHPAFPELASRVAASFPSAPAITSLVRNGAWDPFGFITACEEASTKPHSDQRPLRTVQQLEFEVLLAYLQR